MLCGVGVASGGQVPSNGCVLSPAELESVADGLHLLLLYKRRAHELTSMVDEKDQMIQAIERELKLTKLHDLDSDANALRKEAALLRKKQVIDHGERRGERTSTEKKNMELWTAAVPLKTCYEPTLCRTI